MASAKHASVDRSSFDLVAPEFGNVQAVSKTHVADASTGLEVTGDVALVGVFLVVQLVMVTKVMTKRGKAGEAAPPVARTSPVEGVDRPPGPRRKRATRGIGARDVFLHHNFETSRCGLPVA